MATTQKLHSDPLLERRGKVVAGTTSHNVASKYWCDSYRHAHPYPRGNLYYVVRRHLGMTQTQVAQAFGCTLHAWIYRERSKRMYHLAEILALLEFSGLTTDEYIKLLNDVA